METRMSYRAIQQIPLALRAFGMTSAILGDNARGKRRIGVMCRSFRIAGVQSHETQGVWRRTNGRVEEGGRGRIVYRCDSLIYEEKISRRRAGDRDGAGHAGVRVSREV